MNTQPSGTLPGLWNTVCRPPPRTPCNTQTTPCRPPLSAVGKRRKGGGREPSLTASGRRRPGEAQRRPGSRQTLNVPFWLHVVTSQSQMQKLSRHLLCNWDWNAQLLEGVSASQKPQGQRRWGGGRKNRRDPKINPGSPQVFQPGRLGPCPPAAPAPQARGALGPPGIVSWGGVLAAMVVGSWGFYGNKQLLHLCFTSFIVLIFPLPVPLLVHI